MYIETEDGFDFGRAFSAPGGGAARLREWDDLNGAASRNGRRRQRRANVGPDGAWHSV